MPAPPWSTARASAPCRWTRRSATNLSRNFASARRRPSCAATGRQARISDGPAARALLDLFLIEKAAYELAYEAANRPTWIGVPLAGLSSLVARIIEKDGGGRNG